MSGSFWRRALRHPGFVIGALLVLTTIVMALVSLVWTPHPYDDLRMALKLRPPSDVYPLGTDHRGRD
ncbi:MAG: ABC transporter permease, partial [Reyranellaceae bacterium]